MKRRPTFVLAIDLGGTKIRSGLIGDDFLVRDVRTTRTPTGTDAEILNALLDVIYTYDRRDFFAVGIGFAGLTSWPDGTVKTAPSLPGVAGMPLRRLLSRTLRKPVFVDNDATLWTYGEAIHGAGRGRRVVAGLILGTGVGGGLVVDGKIFRGKDNATEFGHMIVGGSASDRHGGRGHLEAHIGGWALGRLYTRTRRSSRQAHDLGREARRGSRAARRIVSQAADGLALGLANLITIINPDVVIVGGSVSRLPGLMNRARQELKKLLVHQSLMTPIVRARLGPDAPLIGAAALVRREY